ncbi:LysE family transporter [Bacillus thuringiensis]|uniref:LysE family transporter n=1 Tax=Bacillus thuringiensis TaxID=1428 RepID=UPI001427E1A5|nr:LysE family transporter [Bacillus thuringiensis]NIL29937.1 LysE family transporter [Bacillus thuringiensis]
MNFSAFFTYLLIIAFTPGPNNIMAMDVSRKKGLKKSMGFNGGIFFGFFIVAFLSALFTSKLFKWIPVIEPYFRIVGAIYILYLAWNIQFQRKRKDSDSGNSDSFLSGFLLQFVNIKIILACLTAISTFILPNYHSNEALFLFTTVIAIVGCLGTLLWAICGSVFKEFFTKYEKLSNTIMCLLLVYCAISLFV